MSKTSDSIGIAYVYRWNAMMPKRQTGTNPADLAYYEHKYGHVADIRLSMHVC